MERETRGKCKVCGGKIVELVVQKPVGAGLSMWQEVSQGYHCKDCGIKYQFVPPEEKK